MSDKQKMIHEYLTTQFQMGTIRTTLQADDEILVTDYKGEQMTFGCDDQFNIVNAATGQMIARRTDTGWYNLPSYFG